MTGSPPGEDVDSSLCKIIVESSRSEASGGVVIDGGGVAVVAKTKPAEEDLQYAHGLFQALVNGCRMRLVLELAEDGEMGTGELATRLGGVFSRGYVRRQLKNLCLMAIVTLRQKGGRRLYRLEVPVAGDLVRLAARGRQKVGQM
jgi:hypothetical protein